MFQGKISMTWVHYWPFTAQESGSSPSTLCIWLRLSWSALWTMNMAICRERRTSKAANFSTLYIPRKRGSALLPEWTLLPLKLMNISRHQDYTNQFSALQHLSARAYLTWSSVIIDIGYWSLWLVKINVKCPNSAKVLISSDPDTILWNRCWHNWLSWSSCRCG